jgi:hypothetical protein
MAGVAQAALVDEATLEQRPVAIVVAASRLEPIVVALRNRTAGGKHGAAQDEQDNAGRERSEDGRTLQVEVEPPWIHPPDERALATLPRSVHEPHALKLCTLVQLYKVGTGEQHRV